LILSKTGFYDFEEKSISSNLFDIDESNVNSQFDVIDSGTQKELIKETREKHDLTKLFMGIALLLLLFELIVIKWRGDV